MRTDAKTALAILGLFLLSPALSRANTPAEQNRADTERFQYPLRVDTRRMDPSERVKLSVRKAEANPSLRNRWSLKAHQPPSPEAIQVDNLAMKIISDLGQDGEFADKPILLKVRSVNGNVVLEGVVNSAVERKQIEEKARRMNGVRSVQNRLRVKSSEKDLAAAATR